MSMLTRWEPLTRWNPIKEIEEMEKRLSAMLGRPAPAAGGDKKEAITVAEWSPLVDISEDEKEYTIKAELPEVKKEDVKVEVTDVDLAGELEPIARRAQWLRVMRPVTSPAIRFKYTISLRGQVQQQGEVQLRDMNYLDGFSASTSSDPLGYEKRMLDRWFQRELAPTVAALGR